MKPWRAITRMLAVLAILGLVIAPYTAPAVADALFAPIENAGVPKSAALAGVNVAVTFDSCCVPARPFMPEGAKACPLAALCHAKILQDVLTDPTGYDQVGIAQVLVPANDAALSTLAQAPPARPPRA